MMLHRTMHLCPHSVCKLWPVHWAAGGQVPPCPPPNPPFSMLPQYCNSTELPCGWGALLLLSAFSRAKLWPFAPSPVLEVWGPSKWMGEGEGGGSRTLKLHRTMHLCPHSVCKLWPVHWAAGGQVPPCPHPTHHSPCSHSIATVQSCHVGGGGTPLVVCLFNGKTMAFCTLSSS